MTEADAPTRILLVEDSVSLAAVYQGYLQSAAYEVSHVETGKAALERLLDDPPEVVLLDLMLPDIPGMDVLRAIQERELPTAAIIITAHGSVDVAVEAMRYGADDFLTKPFDAQRLRVTLDNVLRQERLERIVETYQKTFDREAFHDIVGGSLPMQAVYRILENAAPSKASVFITGESGTGKELCAAALHKEGPRREQPFVALNCAAIPRELIESEVFGHAKGAFTGAASAREGAASRADGGILFLDEICEMDINLQSKLLRFIQTGTFQRVGENRVQKVDIRFVCATNRDPLVEVREGRFREDLYYRLNVIPVELPPLRERGDDVLLIAERFLAAMAAEEGKQFRAFSPAVQTALQLHSWPGNVRELQNVVRNIVVLNDGPQVTTEMLPQALQVAPAAGMARRSGPGPGAEAAPAQAAPDPPAERPSSLADETEVIRPLWIEERELIERAVRLCDGNVPKAAALLEISASTIYRKRQAWQEADAG